MAVVLNNPWGFKDKHVLKALGYMQDVLSGAIPAGEYVRQACQRQLDDLNSLPQAGRFHFDEDKAGKPCRFIELLPHIEGPLASLPALPDGQPDPRGFCILEGWQCFVVTTVFGWRDRKTGGRRYRKAYVEVPRGNGKSFLSSGIALYMLCADGEAGAQVYSAATTRHQARIVWRVAKQMMEKAGDFRKRLGLRLPRGEYGMIVHPKSFSRFEALSRQAKNQDGLNIHGGIVDELHAHKTREVYDVVETGIAKRIASLLWVITTAGDDSTGICYEVRGYVARILAREVSDDQQFGIVYTIDKGDDWKSPASWRKANPNWGISVEPEAFESNFKKALNTPSAQANFKTKHLDVWVAAGEPWMDMEAYDRCADPSLKIEDFEGQECWQALDLAARIDVCDRVRLFYRDVPVPGRDPNRCCVCGNSEPMHRHGWKPDPGDEPPKKKPCMIFKGEKPYDRHYYVFAVHYCPEAMIEKSKNASYAGWVKEGWLTVTPGSSTDFNTVQAGVLEDRERYQVLEVAYDPWQCLKLAQELEDLRVTCVELRPNVQNFSLPMKEVEAAVLGGRFHHNGDPVLRWMFENVVCLYDAKDNVYPRKPKGKNEKKIDGAVATIMAMNRALLYEDQNPWASGQGFATL